MLTFSSQRNSFLSKFNHIPRIQLGSWNLEIECPIYFTSLWEFRTSLNSFSRFFYPKLYPLNAKGGWNAQIFNLAQSTELRLNWAFEVAESIFGVIFYQPLPLKQYRELKCLNFKFDTVFSSPWSNFWDYFSPTPKIRAPKFTEWRENWYFLRH